jgi:hypothetical protein
VTEQPNHPEVVAAWREYLRTTRQTGKARYEQVEPWAWAQLQRRLKEAREPRRVVV